MPTFNYKAKDNQGKTLNSQIISKDSREALLLLRQQKLTVLSLEEAKKKAIPFFGRREKRVKLSQLARFSRQLATLVAAGVPLVRDLKVLANQFEDKNFQRIATSLCQHIEAGASLSQALGNYPGVFNPLYINMVAAGEASGALSDILERLAAYLEKTDSLLRRVKGAMVYPLAIVVIGLGLSGFLIMVVIPRFKEIFSLLGAELPLPTRLLLNFSDFSRHYFFAFLIAGFFLALGLRSYINTENGKLRFDSFKLRLPLMGPLFQKFSLARFSRTLATLLKSGVPILNSLEIVAKTAGNKLIETTLIRIRQQVSQGQRLATQLAKEKIFPQMISEMVGVGEESGQLDQMLNKIADNYEEEVGVAVNSLLSLIEPVIIVFLGLVVGSIVLAMFLPILKITQVLGGGG